MPGPAIILDEDQADDLRELLALTVIVQEWLEGATDAILDDLARLAYHRTFHPRSYVHWLTEDLASIATRLQAATNHSAETLDTPAPIGNQIPEPPQLTGLLQKCQGEGLPVAPGHQGRVAGARCRAPAP